VTKKVTRDRNAPHKMKGRKVKWTDHILSRSCYLKHVIEGRIEVRIEVMGRRSRRCEQLLNGIRKRKDAGI
jgi:hypothetical protein